VGALWNCKAKTWMMCAPTSDRIAEDIMKIVPVLENHRGQGRGGAERVLPHGPAVAGRLGDCTRKPRVRQRKATLVAKPYHP